MKGVHQKFLEADLSSLTFSDYEVPQGWYRKHLGGRGIAARILIDELDTGIDPLGEENILIFGTGPFQGTNIPGAARHLVMAKSPKTKTLNGSYCSGYFSSELATSGYDGIILRGKADRPVYVTLAQGEPAFHEAEDIWGSVVTETEDYIHDRHGDSFEVSSIGPAGENLVNFSCIIHKRRRAAGRPGLGAVMGSKNLKAVAVEGGNAEKPYAEPEKFQELRAEFARSLLELPGPKGYADTGTLSTILGNNELGMLPTKNFQEGVFDGAENLSAERILQEFKTGEEGCPGCPVRCKHNIETVFEGEKVEDLYGCPEYETLAAFGSLCLNDDFDSIAMANKKCNDLGLDTISAGNIIAFAMEATEKGYLDSDLEWGDSSKIVELVDQMAYRTGMGELLSQGLVPAAKEIGAEDLAMHAKNQELPMHEPRGKKSMAIQYATTPRGGQHMEGLHDTILENEVPCPELGFNKPISRLSWDEKARATKVFEDLRSFLNSLIMCKFTQQNFGEGYNYPIIRDMLSAETGLEVDKDVMLDIGERNYCLLKIWAAKEGYTREDDGLPERFQSELPTGASAGETIPDDVLEENLDLYYELRGFDEQGPTSEKLSELRISDLSKE